MEYLGGNSEGEWTSLSGMYTAEEADFMAQLLGNCSFPNQADQSTTRWHAQQDSFNSQRVLQGSYYSSDNANSNLFSVTTYSAAAPTTSVLFPISSDENYYMSDAINNRSKSMEFCVGDAKIASSYLVEGQDCSLSQDLGKREEADRDVVEPATEEKCSVLSENSRKRSRSSADLSVQKSKRNVKARKNQKAVLTGNNDEDGNGGLNVQSSSSCSDEDSNGSQETSTGGVASSLSSKGVTALNSNGKIRASRGSATDPQSLYARKRRERINERLKVLQNLVPNGTKVDISTMLEEAVEYVKFLQLQIKLLSSDDMWMYAPIAYNGMDLGLNFRVPASRGPE